MGEWTKSSSELLIPLPKQHPCMLISIPTDFRRSFSLLPRSSNAPIIASSSPPPPSSSPSSFAQETAPTLETLAVSSRVWSGACTIRYWQRNDFNNWPMLVVFQRYIYIMCTRLFTFEHLRKCSRRLPCFIVANVFLETLQPRTCCWSCWHCWCIIYIADDVVHLLLFPMLRIERSSFRGRQIQRECRQISSPS